GVDWPAGRPASPTQSGNREYRRYPDRGEQRRDSKGTDPRQPAQSVGGRTATVERLASGVAQRCPAGGNPCDRAQAPGGERACAGSAPTTAQPPAGPPRASRSAPDQDQYADRRGGGAALVLTG